MSRQARVFSIAVLLGGAALMVFAPLQAGPAPFLWLPLLALGSLGLLAARIEIKIPNRSPVQPEIIFFFAGLFLLPYWVFNLLVVFVQLMRWVEGRLLPSAGAPQRSAQDHLFNAAGHLLSGAAGWLVFTFLGGNRSALYSSHSLLIAAVSALIYTIVRQSLHAQLQTFLAGTRQETALLVDAFLVEYPLVCLGYSVVISWTLNPWLILIFLAPILLAKQAQRMPALHQERVDRLQKKTLDLTEELYTAQSVNQDMFRLVDRIYDARDPYSTGADPQVAAYAVAISRELGLPPERVEVIRQAAELHDIGKIAIPEAILYKTGRLSDAEYNTIKRHSLIGAKIVESLPALCHLAPFVRHHHERWDGQGYPDGLVGENIPLESRILSLCDAVESMASGRYYRKALPPDMITAELRRCRGTQFDPTIADMMVRIIERDGKRFVRTPERLGERRMSRSELLERARTPAEPA